MPPSARQSFVIPWKVGEGWWMSFSGANRFKGKSDVKRGYKTYELSNHLGNVLATVSDRRVCGTCTDSIVDFYDADILTISDDYPFGMTMQGRTQYAEKYRFGFNGMEKYDHWQGEGHAYDFGARVYDSRLGRWMSVDPLAGNYPSVGAYIFALNTPIQAKDSDGRFTIFVNGYWNPNGGQITGTKSGVEYWGRENDPDKPSEYIKSAMHFLNDVGNGIDYVDGRKSWRDRATKRFSAGYEYARQKFEYYASQLKRDEAGNIIETVKFVTHSMGAAYAEGMISYFEQQGIRVETVVHLSPFQAGAFPVSPNPNTLQLSLTGDWLCKGQWFNQHDMMDNVDRFGIVDYDTDYPHAFTKRDYGVWDMVKDLAEYKPLKPIQTHNRGQDNTAVSVKGVEQSMYDKKRETSFHKLSINE